jgi:hypothetical protein
MAESGGPDLHQLYYTYLLDRVRDDRYPSTAMLDMLEQGIRDDEQRAAYVDVLLDKLEQDRYPSLPMLRRLCRVAR